MSVAKPWMPGSPAPPTFQTDWGVPGCVFSQGIGFTFANEQGSTAPAFVTPVSAVEARTSAINTKSDRTCGTANGRGGNEGGAGGRGPMRPPVTGGPEGGGRLSRPRRPAGAVGK